MLDHERLDVYQCALQFAALTFKLISGLPRGQGDLADQLKRAALSIPLNIAEGTGKPGEADRRRFFAIARGSAMECGAILDLLELQRVVEPSTSREAKALAVRIVAMLTVMCRKL